jgi:hypothetical protein
MRTIHLSHKLPDEEADALAGTLLTEDAFDTLIAEDADVYKPDGSPLIRFRRQALPSAVIEPAYRSLYDAARLTDNRGMAGGVLDADKVVHQVGRASRTRYRAVKSDDKLSATQRANVVNSGIVGYFDRNPRIPYCRLTEFNLSQPDKFQAALPFIHNVDKVFREHAPERYQAQLAAVEQTSPDFYIKGTAFTTITVNRSFRTAVHKDVGDYKQGFGVMSAILAGQVEGCYLCFPQYRVAVNMRTRDVCLADVHEWHGNTPLLGAGIRLSCVFYYRERMMDCGTVEQELARAKTGTKKVRNT